ncbi:MAG: protein-export chaperone SecB [Gammaproteobacteria bacterium]|jgi:preprotein translocase subunit SecB|nr:protein-export chaperone SecB [Gammaproteobacteria bacterium]MBI5617870.1 protein-export chaperone SecB [Gammaproteobacteria bacterium]
MANEPVQNENQPQYGQLGIQKIYVKDLSFEAPNSPKIFTEQVNPTVDIHFANNTQALGPDVHEVVLTVTANVKQGDKSIYLIEVQQAGVFSISGFPAEHLPAILATACPNILFPFAREAICDVVTKGGFPQLLLAPVNFEMLYAQELQRRQAEAAGQGETPAH